MKPRMRGEKPACPAGSAEVLYRTGGPKPSRWCSAEDKKDRNKRAQASDIFRTKLVERLEAVSSRLDAARKPELMRRVDERVLPRSTAHATNGIALAEPSQ